MDAQKFSQEFKNWMLNYKVEREEYFKLVYNEFNKSKLDLISDFFLSAKKIDLAQLCTPDMTNFIFNNNGNPVFIKDEPSLIRKARYGEKDLVCSYFYSDPRESIDRPPSMNMDVIAKKTKLPISLKEKLEDLDFFADSLIDFEILEFPHFTHESYYFPMDKMVEKLQKEIGMSNKEIAEIYKKQEGIPFFRDLEKIHLKFVSGFGKDKQIKFLPVFIGFGTNCPYGLRTLPDGQKRFLRYSLEEEVFIEKGKIKQIPIDIEQFLEQFDNPQLDEVTYDGTNPIYCISDMSGPYRSEDADRFKGFIKEIKGAKGSSFFKLNPFYERQTEKALGSLANHKNYLHELINGHNPNVIRSQQDLFNLTSNAIKEYELFSALEFEPTYVVKRLGVSKAYDHVKEYYDCGEYPKNALNVASELYRMGLEDFERLKMSSILLGNYIKSGKLQETLESVRTGAKISLL